MPSPETTLTGDGRSLHKIYLLHVFQPLGSAYRLPHVLDPAVPLQSAWSLENVGFDG